MKNSSKTNLSFHSLFKNYIPTILNACIEEFDLPPSTIKVHRTTTNEPILGGTYGATDPIDQPIVVGTGDENDLLTD